MVAIGCIFLVVAALWLALKLYVSFDTEGGAIGMVPILDGAIAPPIAAWIGLHLIQKGSGWPGWPWWGFVLGWLATVVATGWLLLRVGRFGERYHRNRCGKDRV